MNFNISEDTFKDITKWTKNHICKYRQNDRTVKYIFDLDSGIGYGCIVECRCGAKWDFTEYDKW